jgi:hypothetical protein
MRQFMMTVTALAVFGAMVVTAQGETPNGGVSHRSAGYSDWATAADFHKLFDAMNQQHRYPRVIEARVFKGVVLYHGAFEPYPAGCPGAGCTFHSWTYMGMTPDLFARRNDSIQREGGRLVHKQSVHLGGREFIQAIWVRTGQALSAATSTCTGLKSVCLSGRECSSGSGGLRGGGRPFCGGKFCDYAWEQCMKSRWWQGSLISRPVERR